MTAQRGDEGTSTATSVPVLSMADVVVEFVSGSFRKRLTTRAVDGVSLEVPSGSVVGVVGESGSGKSTLARAALRLVPVKSGRIAMNGDDVTTLDERQFRPKRRTAQMVFQDPYSSIDASASIRRILAEPLIVHKVVERGAIEARATELLESVGLDGSVLGRYPHEFSGGQRQRIAIARALALDPDLLVLDEAVSALDVSTQNQILDLLDDIRERVGIAMLFISHDLAVVRGVCDRSIVMYSGRVVERGTTSDIFQDPLHPYTKMLLSSIPTIEGGLSGRYLEAAQIRAGVESESDDGAVDETACPFASRCPDVMPHCVTDRPPEIQVQIGRTVECHLYN